MTTGLLLVATGRYQQFLPSIVSDARTHVSDLGEIFVFSDTSPVLDVPVTWLPWGNLPWPYPTLLRYHAFTAYRSRLEKARHLLYVDVDMRILRGVDLTSIDGTLATLHPGYVGVDPDDVPYERNPRSGSSVALGAGAHYFCGAVQGGSASAYLDACAAMATRVNADIALGITPVHHDESVWNGYLAACPPSTIWDARYCTPETLVDEATVIAALDKDHGYFRGTETGLRKARSALGRLRRRFTPADRF